MLNGCKIVNDRLQSWEFLYMVIYQHFHQFLHSSALHIRHDRTHCRVHIEIYKKTLKVGSLDMQFLK